MMTGNARRTFAFVDLSGFTALTEAHGDEEAVATLGRFRDFTQAALGPRDVLVKTIGDAVMLAFFEPAHAVLALRRVFQNVSGDPSMPLVRAGAHHGSAIAEGDDFFGSTVNLAARVAAHAGGGQLLVTEEVALTATGTGEVVTHVGAMSLRNIAQPVDLYEIELNPGADVAIDPVCAMKVPTSGASAVHLCYDDRDVWFCGLPCLSRYAAAPDTFARRTDAGRGGRRPLHRSRHANHPVTPDASGTP